MLKKTILFRKPTELSKMLCRSVNQKEMELGEMKELTALSVGKVQAAINTAGNSFNRLYAFSRSITSLPSCSLILRTSFLYLFQFLQYV